MLQVGNKTYLCIIENKLEEPVRLIIPPIFLLFTRVLNHPHIVQFYGISLVTSTSRMIFVMEKCKGNLKNYIFTELKSAAGRSENPTIVGDLCRYAKEITDGLAFIHAMEVVHRDLKLENILVWS